MRKIIHCDCDCFYAAVEVRDQPVLRGQPVAVGGDPGRRGVIATCNYEAREFGVRSAMASGYAKKICPELVILKPNFEKYRAVSKQIHEIFREYTQVIEPLSLDEAYLDVSNSPQCEGRATRMAQEIRRKVAEKLHITISAGVAPNKFLAKVASDWRKPNGLFVVLPEQVEAFVAQLPVNKLFGVGQITARKLQLLGVETCGDLRRFSVFELTEQFGSFGERLYQLCRGIDEREVKTERQRKSLSVEHTYEEDLPTAMACLNRLPLLQAELAQRLAKLDAEYRVVKLFIKLKFSDFTITTLERSGDQPQLDQYEALCEEAFDRGQGKAVRLMGVGVRFQSSTFSQMRQLDFFMPI